MLRMSKLADYGTVIMTAIAREPDTVHSASSVAALTDLPMPTVSKVLKVLLRGKLVVSVRGVSGGYLLSWPPEQITLADVITAVDGPIGMTQCSTTPGVCVQESGCAIRGNWQTLSRVIYEALRQVTLADMSRPVLRAVDIRAINVRPVKIVGRRSGHGPATQTGKGDQA